MNYILHYEDLTSGNFSAKVPEKFEASVFKAEQDNPADGCSKPSRKVSTYISLYMMPYHTAVRT